MDCIQVWVSVRFNNARQFGRLVRWFRTEIHVAFEFLIDILEIDLLNLNWWELGPGAKVKPVIKTMLTFNLLQKNKFVIRFLPPLNIDGIFFLESIII